MVAPFNGGQNGVLIPPNAKLQSLFGGMISALYPVQYFDVSTVRPVEDHQEVFMLKDGSDSIIIDILERIDEPTKEEVMAAHVADILLSFGGQTEMSTVTVRGVTLKKRNGERYQVPCLLQNVRAEPAENFEPTPETRNNQGGVFTIGVVRLEDEKTDLVISCNKPTGSTDDDSAGSMNPFPTTDSMMVLVLSRLEIEDWDLFV